MNGLFRIAGKAVLTNHR